MGIHTDMGYDYRFDELNHAWFTKEACGITEATQPLINRTWLRQRWYAAQIFRDWLRSKSGFGSRRPAAHAPVSQPYGKYEKNPEIANGIPSFTCLVIKNKPLRYENRRHHHDESSDR